MKLSELLFAIYINNPECGYRSEVISEYRKKQDEMHENRHGQKNEGEIKGSFK